MECLSTAVYILPCLFYNGKCDFLRILLSNVCLIRGSYRILKTVVITPLHVVIHRHGTPCADDIAQCDQACPRSSLMKKGRSQTGHANRNPSSCMIHLDDKNPPLSARTNRSGICLTRTLYRTHGRIRSQQDPCKDL